MPQIGERKTKDGITGEWDGQTWRRVESAPAEPQPARFNPSMIAAGPGAIPQGVDVSEAAPTVIPLALAPFAGAGVVGAAARLGAGPAGAGALTGTEELVRTGDIGHAARAGLGAALAAKLGGKAVEKVVGPVLGALAKPLTKAVQARLKHALARTVKEAGEEAAKVAPRVSVSPARSVSTPPVRVPAAASASQPRVTIQPQSGAKAAPIRPQAAKAAPAEAPVRLGALKELQKDPNQLAAWIQQQDKAGQSRGQIAETLRESLAPGAPDVGAGRFKTMVDLVLGAEKKAAAAAPRGASLLDEMTDQARTMAKSTGLTPEEMVQALKKFNPGVGDREAFAAVQRAMKGAQRTTKNVATVAAARTGVGAGPKGPLTKTVYHGTSAKFDVFDPAFSDPGASPSLLGHFFTDLSEGAAKYAGEGGRVIKARLALRKPYRITGKGYGKDPMETLEAMIEDAGGPEQLKQSLVERGYDGIVLRKTWDASGSYQKQLGNTYIAFRPDQIITGAQ